MTPKSPMQVTRALEYANRAMVFLAARHGQEPAVVTKIAEAVAAPPNFLHQVLNNLARAGLVVCRRGMKRGYELAKAPAEISLLDIFLVMEGPLGITSCTVEGNWCPREKGCGLAGVWQEIQDDIVAKLGAATLDRLSATSTKNVACGIRAE